MHIRTMSRVAVIAAALVLAACASGPSYQEQAQKIPTVEPGKGRIYLYRPSSFGAAVQPQIHINGEDVGESMAKGFFYVDLPPGTYDISASTEAERNLNLTLEAGEVKYVRCEVKMGVFVGHVKPVLVDAQVGEKEIQRMKYTGAAE